LTWTVIIQLVCILIAGLQWFDAVGGVIVLMSWSWSRGASRLALLGLDLVLETSGFGLDLVLETSGFGLGLEKKVLFTFIKSNS